MGGSCQEGAQRERERSKSRNKPDRQNERGEGEETIHRQVGRNQLNCKVTTIATYAEMEFYKKVAVMSHQQPSGQVQKNKTKKDEWEDSNGGETLVEQAKGQQQKL